VTSVASRTPDVVPAWFRSAIDDAPEHRCTVVEGHRINLRCWGRADDPGVVLVHGGAAHSGWWDHIAPFLAGSYRVAAVDLSGHGDSDHRASYGLSGWAEEVVIAAAAAQMSGPPVVIGHSMGGWVTASTALRYGDRLGGIVIIDSTLRDQPHERDSFRNRRTPRYDSREAILARFSTVPEQPAMLPYVARHIAEESIRCIDSAWEWKFDRALFDESFFDEGWPESMTLADHLPRIGCRIAFIRTEFGLVPPVMADEIAHILQSPVIEIPEAGHHPMLDQPLPLVAALRAVLAQWTTIDPPGA
jgi:pimeloyl-ACP methyl ester carboxylesterase